MHYHCRDCSYAGAECSADGYCPACGSAGFRRSASGADTAPVANRKSRLVIVVLLWTYLIAHIYWKLYG